MFSFIPPILRNGQSNIPIHPLIAGRWSSRAIDPSREVDLTQINRVFEAARWAPSALNNQPWRFMAFGPENDEALSRARSALTPGNAWVLDAPRLLFILARTDRPSSGKLNPRALYETGMATALMSLEASELGLVFHQLTGFSDKILRREFAIPRNFAVITAAVVGWPGDISDVPQNKRSLETEERVRKPLKELVFYNGEAPST